MLQKAKKNPVVMNLVSSGVKNPRSYYTIYLMGKNSLMVKKEVVYVKVGGRGVGLNMGEICPK